MMDGENGTLVDIDDLDAFAAAVGRLQGDRALAETLVAGGRARLEKTFSRDRIVDQYLDLFAGGPTCGEAWRGPMARSGRGRCNRRNRGTGAWE